MKQTRIRRIVRNINDIILHCTDTKADPRITVADVDRWHRERGWNGCGYHYLVRTDGTVEVGRDLAKPGAHCYDHNAESIGVCYVGGAVADTDGRTRHTDTRTPEQRIAMQALLTVLHTVWPAATLHGHRDYNPAKACPCFDARTEYASIFDPDQDYE